MLKEQVESTNNPAFKVIGNYLLERAETDSSVANSIQKENKSLEECFSYITGEARKKAKSNCIMLSDDEVYGLAVHYYDEDNLKIKNVGGSMVTEKQTNEVAPVVSTPEIKKMRKQKKEIAENQLNLFEV